MSLLCHNVTQAGLVESVRPALVIVCIASAFWLFLALVAKNTRRAAVLVSSLLLLFFSYGHLRDVVEAQGWKLAGIGVGRRCVLLLDAALFGCVAYAVLRTRSDLRKTTAVLNMAAAFLVAMPGGVAVYSVASSHDAGGRRQIEAADLTKSRRHPDIYYIILDGYARGDILKEVYKFDNGEFLGYLRQKGFYVAEKSRANYCQTCLSLASSLNLTYLDDLANRIGAESFDRRPLMRMIERSYASAFLRRRGYVFVAFSSGYSGTEVRGADVYLGASRVLTEFENVLLNTTPIPDVESRLRKWRFLAKLRSPWQCASHRRRILFTFDRLGDISKTGRPTFVFAHIVAPHPPFVFGAHGEASGPETTFGFGDGSHLGMDRAKYVANYTRQLAFVNQKIRQTIDRIMSRSSRPPIVILQADHGPGSMLDWENPEKTDLRERMSILSAYYLPGSAAKELYPQITPVNTFRIVFNRWFGASYKLLKDESFFSTWSHPYKFINIDAKRTPLTGQSGGAASVSSRPAAREVMNGQGSKRAGRLSSDSGTTIRESYVSTTLGKAK
jgi:hypothetical protein